ncbi:MAG: cytochrome c maturation protein CcmE [Bradymonadaceae bacterium]|nr:cytochrome c maturation protein CcmE [Lujinxingiaceae bacterium]
MALDDELLDGPDRPSSRREGPNWGMMIGLLVAMAAITFIVLDGLKAETYFFGVDQAVAQGSELVGKTVRIKGIVENGTIEGTPGLLGHRFRLSENGKSMQITYAKALPDTFQEGVEVVAQGRIDSSMTLNADEVLVKCPSRYEGQPPTALEPQASR